MDLRSYTFQHLPQSCLEKVFRHLPLEQVSWLGRECVAFRNASKSVLVSTLRQLMLTLGEDMGKLEISAKNIQNCHPDACSMYQNIALLHTVLKVCQSELLVIRACCWRYMRDPTVNFCFPAGDLLDEYHRVLSLVQDQEVSKELEPEITTQLFLHTERFLDFFDSVIEPGLAKQGYNQMGIKVMDILDCCQTSNYTVRLNHTAEDSHFVLSGAYELRDIGTIDKPPNMKLNISTELKFQSITRFLRNHVRWNNLFNLLRELWELEDLIEGKKLTPLVPMCHSYSRIRLPSKDDPKDADPKVGQPGKPQTCQDTFMRSVLHIGTRIGVECKMVVQTTLLPFCLEWLKESHIHGSSSKTGCNIFVGIETEDTASTSRDSETSRIDTEVQTDMFFPIRNDNVIDREDKAKAKVVLKSLSKASQLRNKPSIINDPDKDLEKKLTATKKETERATFNKVHLESSKLKADSFTSNIALSMDKGSLLEMELKIQTPTVKGPLGIVESIISVHQSKNEMIVTAIKDAVTICC